MLIDELLSYLFDGQPRPLAAEMKTWLVSSRRFMDFVTASRDKIRKKLRSTQDQEALSDLRLELETAYLLLQERTLSLVYESEQGRQIRSPDFAVTFTTSLTFMVEVTRLRRARKRISTPARAGAGTSSDKILTFRSVDEHLTDTICSKLWQLLPQRSNVLIIGIDIPFPTQNELQAAMLRVQQRAERNDSSFWQRNRFRDKADFFQHYQRLSEVLVRGLKSQADKPVVVWVNSQAKHPLPSKVRTVLYRSHAVQSS
jgi:hypothetical protein